MSFGTNRCPLVTILTDTRVRAVRPKNMANTTVLVPASDDYASEVCRHISS